MQAWKVVGHHLDLAHIGSVLHFTNQKLFWHSWIGGHYEWQEQFCSALYGGTGGETKPAGEREILIIKSAVPSLQSPHTQCFAPVLVCSSSLMIQPISYYQLKHFWPGNKVQFIKLSSKGECILAADLQYIYIGYLLFRPEREGW